MDKTPTVNPKRGNKKLKTNKKQPLKVVYITNPIKFTATASEFRALVQELTGQDADVSDSSRFAAADGVGGGREETKAAAAEGNVVHAGNTDYLLQKGSDLSTFGSYYDEDYSFYGPDLMENFQGLASSNMWHQDSNLDVFKG